MAYAIDVLNKHNLNGRTGEYIGRGSPLGNPFSHIAGTKAQHKVSSRDEAISAYSSWLDQQISLRNPLIIKEMRRLANIAKHGPLNLICFCKPQGCHGDVIRDKILAVLEIEQRRQTKGQDHGDSDITDGPVGQRQDDYPSGYPEKVS